MFTGLIQHVGQLIRKDYRHGGMRLGIRMNEQSSPLSKGESIAVQGVCLTVAELTEDGFECDVLEETLAVTNLSQKREGGAINLERALKSGDRFGGHFVTGHIDGMGEVMAVDPVGRDWKLRVRCPESLVKGMVEKGSVACDGVSLTIAALLPDRSFEIHLIPHTWQHTSLHELVPGDEVNIETDIIGKHVSRYIETGSRRGEITMERLRDAGFLGE